ncbi:MAG: hydroxyacid dehydrogenase [Candidatus Thermoplasmatota archaeon]|jgi:D-3-phosphoglycerate dehydrogenase|nr:hydroxyacid dehydrogenase [Candidatus Thermoplasmatota archaeon]
MKILITDKTENDVIQKLKDAGYEVTFNEMDPNTLLKEISNYDALMVRSRTKVTKEVVEAGAKGKLKVIGRAGIGVDNIDIQTAAKNKIKVVNAPTGATSSVAELALLHMLALARQLPKADSSTKKGEWLKKQLKGNELFGKTLGLIGTGNIGKLLAKYAKALNMEVIGYDPFVPKEVMKKDGIKKIDELGKLMETSDFISLHIPHTPETHYIINENMLAKMKTSAFLINCARGGVVDEKALYNALKNGKIAGAAMDVFEQEPPAKDNPLLTLDNVVVTPHIGANTKEGQLKAGLITAEQIIKVLKGEEPDFWVNKKFFT